MIEITNGAEKFKISKGAFESIYKKQGFRVVQPKKQKGDKTDPESEKSEIDLLTEKPISQWTKADIKTFAEAYEIDLSKIKNANEAKEIIKNFMSKT